MSDGSLPSLRFLCFGVGAIGTYIGGSLALSGNRVVFVERPTVAEEVRRNGLSLQLRDGSAHQIIQPEVVDSLEAALDRGPFDAAILAVKAFDTRALAESLRSYKDSIPPIISFQNGVENEPLLASIVGKEKVIAGTVTTAVGRKGPGSITVERLRGMGIADNYAFGPTLLAALQQAGLKARGYPNPAAMKWSKMLTNLLANASSAILDMPPSQLFVHQGLYAMEVRQLREAFNVMKAQGIPVVDLPATPVRILMWLISALPPRVSQPLLQRAVGQGRGAKMPSFHIDLHSGRRKSEVDYLNGAVERFGKRLYQATPVNQTLNEILLKLTSGELPLETYAHQPEKLLAAIPGD